MNISPLQLIDIDSRSQQIIKTKSYSCLPKQIQFLIPGFKCVEKTIMKQRTKTSSIIMNLRVTFERVVLEGDSEVLYKEIKKDTRCLATSQQIYIFLFHTSPFLNYRLFADIVISLLMPLARWATILSHMSIWKEDVPLDLISVF